MTYFERFQIEAADSPSVDAFGRWRVSSPETIFDIKQLHDKMPLFWDEKITNTSGNATSVHSIVDAATTMHVESGDTVIRQTRVRYNYQPGKSQLVMMTGVLGIGVTSTISRLGYFDQNNGLFFELSGTTLRVVVRKNGVDTATDQADWNKDKLDGSGPSGLTIDVSKLQIFCVDFEWLGAGRVRFGFVLDGKTITCHTLPNINTITSVYMSTPNLPLRYEVSSTGGIADIVHACTTVISEGSKPIAVSRSVSTGGVAIDAAVIGTAYAVLCLRLKSTHFDSSIDPSSVTMITETKDDFRWILSINPTVNDTLTHNSVLNSAAEFAAGTILNTVSDLGTVIAEGYASTDTRAIDRKIESSLRIGSSIDGVADILVLSVMPLAVNATTQASLGWRELQ